MRAERLSKPVPVRLRPTVRQKVLQAARRLRLSPSELIRHAVERKLPEWEQAPPFA